ncbi:Cytochrome P450 52A13 [Cytospora mali]|uniref:Cytochrome P450 52A13 n=1 Tax=Cytospora mali TaxID=578113 RepID=A0A194UR21_CYTMA|nr:Cytochrome P450 52A13 [Valsa mali var. pyri (nom. inval.)]
MGLVELFWENASLKPVLIIFIGTLVVSSCINRIQEHYRLKQFGARARTVPAKLPWALDIIYYTVQATINHKNLEKWLDYFRESRTDTDGNGMFTAELRVINKRTIFTADPENIKAILATQFHDYGKGEIFHNDWREFLGDSIFVTDGQMWHTSRQLLRPQFIRDRISHLHCFESHLETFFKAMANGGALNGEDQQVNMDAVNGKVLDISDLFFRYTLDVSTDFLLGKDVKSLRAFGTDGYISNLRQDFADAFNEVQHIQNILARIGSLPSQFMSKKRFRHCLATVNDFVNEYVQQALRLSPEELSSKTKSDMSYTFLHELASYTRDPKVLRDQLVAVLLAGRDTTAAALSWTIYELGRHPEVVRKLRDEILSVVGPDKAPTYADLKGMKYLQNVINETLRLYPVVPFNVRFALKDTTLPRGGGPDGTQPLAVLKDTAIGYTTLAMHRRPDLYPPVSEDFRPVDEFSPERWYIWQPKPWQYVPFNGGPRICIGQQFALTEMGYVLTRMFQRFDRVESFMGPVDGGSPTLKAEIVLQPGDGVHVAVWQAKNDA